MSVDSVSSNRYAQISTDLKSNPSQGNSDNDTIFETEETSAQTAGDTFESSNNNKLTEEQYAKIEALTNEGWIYKKTNGKHLCYRMEENGERTCYDVERDMLYDEEEGCWLNELNEPVDENGHKYETRSQAIDRHIVSSGTQGITLGLHYGLTNGVAQGISKGATQGLRAAGGKIAGKATKIFGKGAWVISAALLAVDVAKAYKNGGTKAAAKEAVCGGAGIAGAAVGAKAGAAIGTCFGPVGTVIGSVVGGAVGYFVGSGLASRAIQGIKKMFA